MNVEVSKDKVVILQESSEPHENEYNITECHFTFDEFTDLFQVKRAIFTVLSTNEMYETDIINNKCNVPVEVLKHEYETVKLGVYGYNIEIVDEKETLKERFSPSYATFVVPTGSYEEGALSPEIITPSQYDIYSQALQEGLDDVAEALEEVSHVDIDAEQLEHGASVTITNRHDQDKTVVINDGYTPRKGEDYFTPQEINEIEDTVKTNVITELDFDNTINGIREDIHQLDNEVEELDRTKITKDADNLTNYYKKSETYTQAEVDAKVSSVYRYKGSVATYNDLPVSGNVIGDVYNVEVDGSNYAWNGTGWDKLGGEVDLSNYYTKPQVDSALSTKQNNITSSNKLASDLVDDSNSSNKFVSASEKAQITTNENDISAIKDGQELDSFADVESAFGDVDTALGLKEDKANKVTEISSSSTDTEYPSAKCVYDSQEVQNEKLEELEMIYNAFPTVSDEDTEIQLDNTAKVKFREIDLKGNTSQVVIPEETGTSVSNTSIYATDVDTDKENTIELSGNTYQVNTILPSEYTQVDYIESNGTQYIDTGYIITNTPKIETDILITDSNNRDIFGMSSKTDNVLILNCENNNFYTRYGTYTSKTINVSDLISTWMHISYSEKIYINNELKTTFTSYSFSTNTDTFKICKARAGVANSSAKYKYLKLYDNNVLVRDFIPCYRNSDNEVGLYDLVNGVFYTDNASSATPFTYGSVVGIPNPDYPQEIEVVKGTQNVEVCGKNLFNKDNTNIIDNYYLNDSGVETSGNNFYIYPYTIVKPNTTYSIQPYRNFTACYCFYDINKNFISSIRIGSINQDFTTPANCQYLRMSIRKNDINEFQLEESSTATTYEAYTGATYPVNLGIIELCKIGTYQDRIYKKNNKWYLEKKINKHTINGSEEWRYTNGVMYSLNAITDYITSNDNICYCDKYKSVNNISGSSALTTNNTCCFYINTNNIRFYVRDNIYSNADTYKTWLATNNLLVYYVLATPTTTEITDTTLVNQLNALYNATIYPITNINTDTTNLLPYIDLHYNFVTPSPSPSRPSAVNVVKGNNTITISNSDNTESQVFPINIGNTELCKIGTYQDYIYESNGNWYFKKNINKITLNGSEENWSSIVHSGDYYRLALAIADAYDFGLSRNTNLYCDMFKASTTTNYNIVFFSNKSAYFYLPQWMTTKEEFMSFLSTNNSLFYYVLATPTDTQITDTTLITQLNNIKKAYSYDTQTNISQTNTDKPFIIYAEAIRSLKDVFQEVNNG